MPIKANQLREKEDFQQLIIERLHEDNDFVVRTADKFHPGLAMDTEILFAFLEDTQADTMEKLRKIYKERTEDTILNYINAEINKESRGLIDVIKHGVEFDNGATLKLMYCKPDSTKNPGTVANYEKNILSVMEEVYHKADERIDLVIFLNGIAIFAVELKCNTSGQNYEDAIKQYKKQRDYNTRLFKERVGVFAAFAMDLNEVYFCTKLQGESSFFNPFNIGRDFGKGNPHNEVSGIPVSYMWENIWTKDKILFLIERFIYIKQKERRNADTGRVKKSKEVIFPRFHQLRAVERVMNDVMINHSECNYLIEHSAGSGKTETISWLAHILATIHDANNKNIFDTVLVITDRIVVDRQLQEAILGIEHKSGQVKVMDDKCDSSDLAYALTGNTKIIVTTIHKFYYILDNNILGGLKERKFAVLIDEAHSSTEGVFMQSVTQVLSNPEEEEEKTEEDKMLDEIQRCGKQQNVSMIAFTATPKPDTIQLFGTLNAEGHKESFDLYSMKQAIEEGYILNVLDNYVTSHRDYQNLSAVYVKHYPDKIVIENPGGFLEGITTQNIITHPSVPRNKLIAETLQRLKYVQRTGQGVDIIFREMLSPGKSYPQYSVYNDAVSLTIYSSIDDIDFVKFIAQEQNKKQRMTPLAELMVLRYLTDNKRINMSEVQTITQTTLDESRKTISNLVKDGLIELSGKDYMLTPKVYEAIKSDVEYTKDKVIEFVKAKNRILDYLEREESITSQHIRELCGYTKQQARYVTDKMRDEGILQLVGKGHASKYILTKNE